MAISVISMYKVIEYFTKLPYFYSYYNITTFFLSNLIINSNTRTLTNFNFLKNNKCYQ